MVVVGVTLLDIDGVGVFVGVESGVLFKDLVTVGVIVEVVVIVDVNVTLLVIVGVGVLELVDVGVTVNVGVFVFVWVTVGVFETVGVGVGQVDSTVPLIYETDAMLSCKPYVISLFSGIVKSKLKLLEANDVFAEKLILNNVPDKFFGSILYHTNLI